MTVQRNAGARRRIPRLRLAAAAAALLVAACSSGGTIPPGATTQATPAVHETTVDMPDGRSLPVALFDRTGLVASIAGARPEMGDGITGADGNRTLRWQWVGGSCDAGTFLTFERTEAGFRLLTRTETTGDVCDMMGIGHGIEIRLNQAVDPATVVVTPGQP